MSSKLTRWDSAVYLKTDEDIAAYLSACFEEAGDDAAFITHALGVVAKAKGMTQLAKQTGLGLKPFGQSTQTQKCLFNLGMP